MSEPAPAPLPEPCPHCPRYRLRHEVSSADRKRWGAGYAAFCRRLRAEDECLHERPPRG